MKADDILDDLDDASPADDGPPKTGNETLSAEPPKWRFVKEAKKSLGYSSAAAGSYIRGKSSDELGAKYSAPDISLYRPTQETPVVHEIDAKAPSFRQFEKEEGGEVGALQPRNLYSEAPYTRDLDVGKLDIDESKESNEEVIPDEKFGSLPKFHSFEETSTKSYRQFDNKYEVGEKTGRKKGVWFDGDVSDNYRAKSWTYGGGAAGEVGRLKFQGTDSSEETFDGSFSKVKKEEEEVDIETLAPTGIETSRAVSERDSSSLRSDENVPVVEGMSRAVKKKMRWLVILVLILVPLVLILGILLGKERSKEDPAITAAAAAPFFTENATEVPSMAPSVSSSSNLVPTPLCSKQDFDICIAVDMSGSVCNGGFFGFGGTGDCVGCPLFECRNVFLDSDTCCDNFGTIKSFSQVMIRALAAEFPAEKGFSIVQFASDASIASLPQSANDALSTVSQLSYSGGVTNHAAAISFCRQSLSSSQYPDRKKFMMLITDGEPTAPEDDPEGAAISAASQAKNDGIFIIPIFISPTYTFDPFMSALSSDGKVFDVTSFDELLSLQESLVNQVSCSS